MEDKKPEWMSAKEWMVKKTAIAIERTERVVNSVVSHQFDEALNAMEGNNIVEIYSFGKFIFNKKRAWSEMRRMEYILGNTEKMYDVAPESRKGALRKRIENLKNNVSFLNDKISYNGK